MDSNSKKPIVSFHDLEVYRDSYKISITVMTKIVLQLPENDYIT